MQTDTKIKFKKIKNVSNPKSIHGIYPYRGKISAVDVAQVISQFPKKGLLLDPFCGSGTIIYEAAKHGLDVIGVDTNPIAIQISKAKFSHANNEESFKKIMQIINKPTKGSLKKMPEEAEKYFHKDTANQIMKLKEDFDFLSEYEKVAFLGAICLTARGCNGYKWSSTQIGSTLEEKVYINFAEKFLMKIKKHTTTLPQANVKIFDADTRELSKIIPKNSIDIVYTSPPYFDALDYTSYYTRIVHHIFGNDIKKIKSKLIQKYDTYKEDMIKSFEEIAKVTKKNGKIIFVVGDKKKGDRIINGGDFFSEIIPHKPSYIVSREYTGSASKIWDKINNTSRKEQIIVWEKSKW